MKLQHIVKGLRTMVPVFYRNFHYILAGTDDNNVIFRIIKQGPKRSPKHYIFANIDKYLYITVFINRYKKSLHLIDCSVHYNTAIMITIIYSYSFVLLIISN